MQHARETEGLRRLPHSSAGDGGGLPPPFVHEGQFILHAEGEELLLGILKQRTHAARYFPERHVLRTAAAHEHPAFEPSAEVAGTQTVGKAHERALAAAALPGNQHHFAGAHAEIDVAHGGGVGKRIGVGYMLETYHDRSPFFLDTSAWRARTRRPSAPDSRRPPRKRPLQRVPAACRARTTQIPGKVRKSLPPQAP